MQFQSTDDLRSDGPLRYAQSVDFDQPLSLELGGSLPHVRCAYETWGTLNKDASNAILVCHAISGDSHAARHDDDDAPGWWDALIGPGKPIDTDRFFVVCPNVLGGCRGTTGPGDLDPATKRPYGADFPRITIGDMVAVQRRLADHLGINRWKAVVGGSLGGHQVLTWVTRYPDSADTCIAIATSPRLTSQALGFDVVGRNAIQSDPSFADGQYYDRPSRPDTGLAIARMLGHITYLSSQAMDAKFDPDRHDPRQIASDFEQRFSVGSYLAHQGQKFVTRFDANSYITLTMAMDLFDLGDTRLKLMERFDDSDCNYLIVSFSSDWLFTPQQSRDIVNALTALDHEVTYAEITTDAGHDAFLIESDIDQYGPLVRAKLGDIDTSRPPLKPADEAILELIPDDASVLDLGCGSGRLLSALATRGRRRLMGVEVAQAKILAAAARGLDVIDYDLNKGLPAFIDNQFDFVVLNSTLQAVENVESLFGEMMRVGRHAVLSFPNFAFRDLRDHYVRQGRSPKSQGEFNHDWFNTPNRRFPSIADVLEFCQRRGVTVNDAVYLDTTRGTKVSDDDDPNLNADVAVILLSAV
ncbi:homoserine O-acetyltransferase MetX [Crateriforma conspicua]|uniref:Homoserine O-acetyltransferase n=1 Tax=Crateriforma conspicua TaxID=2527996 RepID=A0A5C5Y852_9PLAN|nr:homoserine O-acetyltransferase [Crateriforma conspicua]QDV65749.1 Homoserine O-acetyltransferase [Crateriforma conspicua]TWT71149.1 Homoserine O-acetyltransferase [Crateriforma conspicua]